MGGLGTLFRHRRGEADTAAATVRQVTVVNLGTTAVVAVHARPFGAREWGVDLLCGRNLQPGGSGEVAAAGDAATRRWDVSVVYRSGAVNVLRGIDLAGGRHIAVTEAGARTC
jgi:hypothetical protein